MSTSYEGLCERNNLPSAPNEKAILDCRWSARTGDWHILTEDGWFYCRAGDVEPDRRRWLSSLYGPTAT